MFDKKRKGTGTKEWSDISYNIQMGCPNNCVYCYAREIALKRGFVDDRQQFDHRERINPKKAEYIKRGNGLIMFPTMHDITLRNMHLALQTVKNMVICGNNVLIVSKPRLQCMELFKHELEPYKDQVLFRFTITSVDPEISSLFEPNAPSPQERLLCLDMMRMAGFSTSVACEPLLGGSSELASVIKAVEAYVTHDIWIGKLNKPDSRIFEPSAKLQEAIDYVVSSQSDDKVLDIYHMYKNNDKIKFKDSMKSSLHRKGIYL